MMKKNTAAAKKAALLKRRTLHHQFDDADYHLRNRNWTRALQVLQQLKQKFPHRLDLLDRLWQAAQGAGDFATCQEAAEEMANLRPDDVLVLFKLACACMNNDRSALAARAFRRAGTLSPKGTLLRDFEKHQKLVESHVAENLNKLGLNGPDGMELACLHEQVQSYLERGGFAAARETAEELLRRRPDFVPALNNSSEAWFRDGHSEQAIAGAERVLKVDPDNFHAVANLARYCFLSGRHDESRAWSNRLTQLSSESMDFAVKKAETWGYLGDHESTLELVREADRSEATTSSVLQALLYHLGAVSAWRLGHEDEARCYWDRALQLAPHLRVVRDNLADLRKPVAGRHGPWPFAMPCWLAGSAVREFAAQAQAAPKHAKTTEFVPQFLERHPEWVALVPHLLDRGDPDVREFALQLAEWVQTPALLDALAGFALGQRGPDASRFKALKILHQAKRLPDGVSRMWVEGQWRDIALNAWELYSDGDDDTEHSPEVARFKEEACHAQRNGHLQKAETILRQALKIEPNKPDLLNNLAGVNEALGRHAEAEALLRQVFEQCPDYFFGRVGMAGLLVRKGDLEGAKALLDSVRDRKRLHYSEFAALCKTQIALLLAQNELEGARSWMRMWEDADPKHPEIPAWKSRMQRSSASQRYEAWQSRGGT